jgi:hypothetical protein
MLPFPMATAAALDTRRAEAWPLPVSALATTSVVVGVIWDISWHRTIGRDTFWTPAHLAIYLGGILAGLAGAYLILRATFARGAADASVVRIWGFRGPLGAWVWAWGAAAMLVSAPFDDWWHGAYGLDVEILSPPHTVLAAGIIAIQLGSLLVMLSHQNRADGAGARLPGLAFAYATGVLVMMLATLFMEESLPNNQHTGLFYKISTAAYPVVLVAAARGARLAWPATAAAAAFMAIGAAMSWILPLFPAQPLLGPIMNPVDRMVPPPFPMLLVVPALAVDVLMRRVKGRDWWLSLLLGAAFCWIFFVVQFAFSEFMLSPHARNWFFAADRWSYDERLGPWQQEFWAQGRDPVTLRALGVATLLGIVSTRVGLFWGNWMRRVVR